MRSYKLKKFGSLVLSNAWEVQKLTAQWSDNFIMTYVNLAALIVSQYVKLWLISKSRQNLSRQLQSNQSYYSIFIFFKAMIAYVLFFSFIHCTMSSSPLTQCIFSTHSSQQSNLLTPNSPKQTTVSSQNSQINIQVLG